MAIDRDQVQRSADKLVRQGKIMAAIEQYGLMLKDNPSDLVTINKIGDLYARAGRPADAVRHFQRIASDYTQGGFFLKAIAIYKKILKLDPHAIDSMLRLGGLYARQDLVKESRDMYASAAGQLIARQDYERAKEAYEKLVRIEPGVVESHVKFAEVLQKAGDPDRARDEFVSAAALMSAKGRGAESVDLFRRALAASPPSAADGAEIVRRVLAAAGGEAAAPLCEELRGRYPDSPEILDVLIEAYERSGRREAAETLAVEASATPINPGPMMHLVLARLHARAGRVDEAGFEAARAVDEFAATGRAPESTMALDEMIELLPGSVPLLTRRLEALKSAGDHAGAAEMKEKLAEAFRAAGRPEQASLLLEKAPPSGAALSPERLHALFAEVDVFLRYGVLDKASSRINTIVQQHPSDLAVRRRARELLVEAGMKARAVEECIALAGLLSARDLAEEAIAVLREALNLDPGNARASGMLSMLQTAARHRPPAAAEHEISIDLEEEESQEIPAIPLKEVAAVPASLSTPRPLIDLTDGLAESLEEALSEPGAETPQSLPGVIQAFREAVKREVGDEDYRTHFELGIAYKEMGLLDEAIAEFDFAARSPEHFLDSCGLLALCHRERGEAEEAERCYRRGLEAPAGEESAARRLGLTYELGDLLASRGDWQGARDAFEEAFNIDADYLDLEARLREARDRVHE